MKKELLIVSFFMALALWSCKKDADFIPDNDAPYYGVIPTVIVENYVNRTFIDLIGREPFDTELAYWVEYLRTTEYATSTRVLMVNTLQNDTAYIEGDISYKHAYYQRFYDLVKTRFIEGASDDIIYQRIGNLNFAIQIDSLNGAYAAAAEKLKEVQKLLNIVESKDRYREGEITIDSVCAFMVDNAIFDEINMNTFNFVNATFDSYFWRYPTQTEFWAGFNMIETNQSEILFGQSGGNRADFVNILISQNEFYEGNVIWAYTTLLAREPSTQEIVKSIGDFVSTKNFQKVQRDIVISDEYAGFDKVN